MTLEAASPLDKANPPTNSAKVAVEAVDARVRVLYVEDQARFEYRYLKNLLMREPTVVSSVLLLSADPEFPQEGNEPIRRFPTSPAELNAYDVVLLGDVDPGTGWTSADALANLADWVEHKGGGLAWLAGSRFGPEVWRNTPLGKLLPVQPAGQAVRTGDKASGYRPALSPEGRRSPIFLLDPAAIAAGTDPGGIVASLPAWHWAASVGQPTPAAQALAVHPVLRSGDGPLPLVVAGYYGAGRTVYCGTDDVWQWRRYRDIEQWRSFWLQTVRWLAGPRRLGRTGGWCCRRARTACGSARRSAWMRVRDEVLAGGLPDRLQAVVGRAAGQGGQTVWLKRSPGRASFVGSISPEAAGPLEVRVDLPDSDQSASTTLTAELPEAETADSPADPGAMDRWVRAVEQAHGQAWTLDLRDLDQLSHLPLPTARVQHRLTDIRLWDNWLALLLVTGMFLSEWVWRRGQGHGMIGPVRRSMMFYIT